MAMSKWSGGEKQEDLWIAHTELAVAPGHPLYKRLNELLEGAGFDEFVEGSCARFYHARLGRPTLRPGVYFRALLVGYFEGIDRRQRTIEAGSCDVRNSLDLCQQGPRRGLTDLYGMVLPVGFPSQRPDRYCDSRSTRSLYGRIDRDPTFRPCWQKM